MTYFLKSQSMKKLLCNLPRFVLWIAFLLIIESYVTLQLKPVVVTTHPKQYQGKLWMKPTCLLQELLYR